MARWIRHSYGRSFAVLLVFLALPSFGQDLLLPNSPDSLRFAVIGDTGTGGRAQYEIAREMEKWHTTKFPFELVLMLGDNMYGDEDPRDYRRKFEIPYRPLLRAGVKFYASLGNHDDDDQRFYEQFNMQGQRYYTFRPKAGVRFFALDSNYMDAKQLDWIRSELSRSGSEWKICFFHHPLYSSGGRHGSDEELRAVLEPIFEEHGVSVVFSGHEHFYERIKPQNGIYYFISGAGGKLRRGNIRKTEFMGKGFDTDYHFMLLEINGDEMHFQTISRKGKTVDAGVIERPKEARPAAVAAGESLK
ncbi:MAG: metallophosphoesterase [Acidobacteria bacterium]|nr:metallophosphoesterase [Acidobacteriota bacterium]